jgi:hypothetical protein
MPESAAMQDRLQQTQPRKRYLKRCCACETVENQRLHRTYKKMTIVGSARFRVPERFLLLDKSPWAVLPDQS